MMKKISLFLSLLTFVIHLHAQDTIKNNLLEYYETVSLGDDKKIEKPAIVDINGEIKIVLNKEEILKRVTSKIDDKNVNELVRKNNDFNDLLKSQIDILEIIQNQRLKAASQKEKMEALGQYSELMNEFYNKIIQVPAFRAQANSFMADFFSGNHALGETKFSSPQAYVIAKFGEEALITKNALYSHPELFEIRILLIAFINSKSQGRKRVHVENFDSYALGEFHEVERFVTTFSDEQINSFEETNELANELNVLINREIQEIGELLRLNFQSIDCFNRLMINYQEVHNNRDILFQNNVSLATRYLDSAFSLVREISSVVNEIKSIELRKGSPNLLEIFNEKVMNLRQLASKLPKRIDDLFQRYGAQVRENNQELTQLKAKTINCLNQLENDIQYLEKVYNWGKELVVPMSKISLAADEIGEEVKRFSINSIPEAGFIDLKFTGSRENRDNIEIRLISEKGEGQNLDRSTLSIERLRLQQIKLYSITKINLILCHPHERNELVTLENDFQFAPSGSVLFKFGSRKSNFYNDFLDPGIGVNFSTPDFNLDGVPDFSTGIILTFVKDILSVGWNYNTVTDTPFVFFGVSLPFNMPGIPINTMAIDDLD